MKICQVNNLKIGEGKPCICLPIVGKDDEDVYEQAMLMKEECFDIVELRIDYYHSILDYDKVACLIKNVKEILKKPLLLTYRSLKEGGEVQLTNEQYLELIRKCCQCEEVDFIDIELENDRILVYQLVELAHSYNKKVIMSHHDFDKTPLDEEMIDYFERMEAFGADIGKMAVMPLNQDDVIRLLNMTSMMSKKLNIPIVTMSMGQLGCMSRLVGEIFGSSITFACLKKASAPGQIQLKDMNMILDILHDEGE